MIVELRGFEGVLLDGEGCLRVLQDSFLTLGVLLGTASSQKGSGGRKRRRLLVTRKTTWGRRSRQKLKYEVISQDLKLERKNVNFSPNVNVVQN